MVPKRIVVFGASTVYGRVDVESGGFVTRLRRWHESQSREHAVFNLGVGGDTTWDMMRRLVPESSHRRPDLIIINVGLNDTHRVGSRSAPRRSEPDIYRENVKRLIVSARNLSGVLILGAFQIDETKTAPFGDRNWFYLAEDAKLYEQITREVAEELRVPYVGLMEKWKHRPLTDYLAPDGLHCSSQGHELIFEEVKAAISNLYKQ